MPNTLSCLIDAVSESLSAVEKPAPSERLPVGFSLTVMVRSTWSSVPGTSLVSTLTSLKKPRRSTRSRESLIRLPSYQVDSNWRNSRRTTSSRVRVLPATLMRRT